VGHERLPAHAREPVLLGGSAGDRYGRRKVFVAGLIGFVAASLACGLAPNAAWLVGARLAQGAAAALLTPTSLAIIGGAYHGPARGPAIGTWAAAAALTTALGPPLGGWLVDTLGWRSIFFINLPLGAAALWLATKLPADRGDTRAAPLDRRGAMLAIAALALACYGSARRRQVVTERPRSPLPTAHGCSCSPRRVQRTDTRSRCSPIGPPARTRWRCLAAALWCCSLPFIDQVHGYSALAWRRVLAVSPSWDWIALVRRAHRAVRRAPAFRHRAGPRETTPAGGWQAPGDVLGGVAGPLSSRSA
jgi:hypothetical protein